jgi:hypothetical protein
MKRVIRQAIGSLMVAAAVLGSGVGAQAATVTQLNITGGSVNLDFGALGTISGSFQQTGTLMMGTFQPPPDYFLGPVVVDGHTVQYSTQSQGGLFAAPSAQTSGTMITADLSSLFVTITGPLSGSLNIGGAAATGTYDPVTGQFSLSWTRVLDVASANFGLEGTADVTPVPLPAAAGLFAAGLASLAGWGARRRTSVGSAEPGEAG